MGDCELLDFGAKPAELGDDEIYDAAFAACCDREGMTRELFRMMWESNTSFGWHKGHLRLFARQIAETIAMDAVPKSSDNHPEDAREKEEPVAEVVEQDTSHHGYARAIRHLTPVETKDDLLPVGAKLYTHPPRREFVGLTDGEREDLEHAAYLATFSKGKPMGDYATELMRVTEAKLREKNK